MTTLTMELPPEVYRRLYEEADRLGKPPQVVAQEWLVERLAPQAQALAPGGDREKVRQALQAAGLLTELSPNLRKLADPTVHLEDVRAALERAGGKTLGEIVLEQRGLKE
jgi:predicted transcriptional regulator